jgi:hypothetical protein
MAYGGYKERVSGLRQNTQINPYGQGQAQQQTAPLTCPPCSCPKPGVNGWLVLGLVTGATLLGVAIAS